MGIGGIAEGRDHRPNSHNKERVPGEGLQDPVDPQGLKMQAHPDQHPCLVEGEQLRGTGLKGVGICARGDQDGDLDPFPADGPDPRSQGLDRCNHGDRVGRRS